MTRLDEPDGGFGGGEPEDEEPYRAQPYDPLIGAWDEPQARGRAFSSDLDDPFAFPAPSAYGAGDEAPVYVPRPGRPPYPDRFEELHRQRLTEFQRRLREGTIVIPRPERRWAVTVRELVETLLLAVLIFLAVRASFQNFRVEGASMQPSLENGEYLIVNKLSYARLDLGIFDWLPFFDSGDDPVQHLWGSPGRGDVVVFRAPTSTNRDFIKRIIGVPGDTVHIDEPSGKVMVNGNVLQEPYIQGVTNCNNSKCDWQVPKANTPEARAECGSDACYFVMGDNRQNSSDSRQSWMVPEENIIGKAMITYWHQGGPELDLAPNHSIGFPGGASAQQ